MDATLSPRLTALAIALGDDWTIEPNQHGHHLNDQLVRNDGLRIDVYQRDGRVSVSPAQVKRPRAKPGDTSPTFQMLREFLPYDERKVFDASATIAAERFHTAPPATLAREITRKVIEPAARAYAIALTAMAEEDTRTAGTEAAADALVRDYKLKPWRERTHYHGGDPTMHLGDVMQIGEVAVKGPDAFRIAPHGMTVTRKQLDAIVAILRSTKEGGQ